MAALGAWRVWTGNAAACGSYDHRECREVHNLWPEGHPVKEVLHERLKGPVQAVAPDGGRTGDVRDRLVVDENAESQDDFEPRTKRAVAEVMDVSLLSKGGRYGVQSASGNRYEVDVIDESCTSPDWQQHSPEGGCKHLRRVDHENEALRYECDVIAFDDLSHIRDRTAASWGHRWAFRTLYEQVEYKAEAEGISVKQVGSAYTSKRCAECGFTVDENRSTRNDFRCVKCESEANADYNAAKNIGMRYVRRGQQSSRRTGNSQLALKSGTVTPSGGFTAHPEGFEGEFMDKPHPQRANPSG